LAARRGAVENLAPRLSGGCRLLCGSGRLGILEAASLDSPSPGERIMPRVNQLRVNGKTYTIDADATASLLFVLRDQLGLTGSKYGCGEGQCGACTVLLNGNPRRSCITKVGTAATREITTIESLEKDGKLHPVQQAFLDEGAMQCAYCTSGMIMTAVALLRANPRPSEDQIAQYMEGNICRCGTYPRMSENPAASRIPEGPEGFDAAMEPERYELLARPAYSFEMQRRDFFKVLGAGILIFCVAKEAFALQESGGGRRQFGGQPLPKEISAWLHLGENGMVTTYTGKVEVGQNVRTSLSQAVAEELRFPIEKITLVMGDTQLTPYDAGTFGIRTTPTMNLKLRQVSAAARDALIELAAKQWNTDAKDLAAADGKITDSRNNRSVEYAELLKGRQITQNIPAEDPLIPPAQWTVEGTPVPKVDGRDFVTGKHRYPSDQALPGMLYGKVLRPPAFGATLSSVDTRPAEQTAGLVVVHDGDFIGVAAPSTDGAAGAVAGIHAEWKTEPGQPSSENVFEYLKDNPEPGRGGEQNTENPPANEAAAPGAQRMSATYTVAYIAHAPLEPRAALAQWTDDNHLTVWTGTQRPFGV